VFLWVTWLNHKTDPNRYFNASRARRRLAGPTPHRPSARKERHQASRPLAHVPVRSFLVFRPREPICPTKWSNPGVV